MEKLSKKYQLIEKFLLDLSFDLENGDYNKDYINMVSERNDEWIRQALTNDESLKKFRDERFPLFMHDLNEKGFYNLTHRFEKEFDELLNLEL